MRNKQTIIISTVVIVVFMLIFSSRIFYVIRPGERGVVFRTITGVLDKDNIRQTGLNIIAPWIYHTHAKFYDIEDDLSSDYSMKYPLILHTQTPCTLSLDSESPCATSRRGEECRLRNPWAGAWVVSEINGGGRELAGELLRFRTAAECPSSAPVPGGQQRSQHRSACRSPRPRPPHSWLPPRRCSPESRP